MIVLIEIKETQYKWKLWFFNSHTIIFSWKLKIMPYLIFSLSTMIPNNNAPFSTTHRSAYVWKVFTTSNPSSFLFGKTEGKLSIIAVSKRFSLLWTVEFTDDSLFTAFTSFNEMVALKRSKNLWMFRSYLH